MPKRDYFPQKGLSSNATESVPAEVKNLREVDPTVSYHGVCDVIAQEYLRDSPNQVRVVVVDHPPRDDPQLDSWGRVSPEGGQSVGGSGPALHMSHDNVM